MYTEELKWQTVGIIEKFIYTYIDQRGLKLPRGQSTRFGSSGNYFRRERVNEICSNLILISDELRDFIRENYRDTFEETIQLDPEEFSYNRLKTLADELFGDQISWPAILTFLVHAAELCCKALETKADSQPRDEKREAKDDAKAKRIIYRIIDQLRLYFEENLLRWICSQPQDWLNVKEFYSRLNVNGKSDSKRVSGKANFMFSFGMALAFVIGGVYLSSKFSLP